MMRLVACLALVLSAGACARGESIYAGSDLPNAGSDGAVIEVPEPAAAGTRADPGTELPEPPRRLDAAAPPLPDAPNAMDAARPAAADAASSADAANAADASADAAAACPPDFADCDGDPANGCEVDLGRDLQHCGACDRVCHAGGSRANGAACVDRVCRLTCDFAPIYGDCDGDPDNGCETDLWHDPNNCSVCGMRCNRCADGVCR